jgi:hypothetical protein
MTGQSVTVCLIHKQLLADQYDALMQYCSHYGGRPVMMAKCMSVPSSDHDTVPWRQCFAACQQKKG